MFLFFVCFFSFPYFFFLLLCSELIWDIFFLFWSVSKLRPATRAAVFATAGSDLYYENEFDFRSFFFFFFFLIVLFYIHKIIPKVLFSGAFTRVPLYHFPPPFDSTPVYPHCQMKFLCRVSVVNIFIRTYQFLE